jgi:hypothetical protein
MEEAGLFVKTITDGGMMLKRRPAHRVAHRIRKRSNHVTIVLGSINNTHKQFNKMGQKTNPIGNRLVSSEDGTQTGMVEMIMVINLPKITKSESISMLIKS